MAVTHLQHRVQLPVEFAGRDGTDNASTTREEIEATDGLGLSEPGFSTCYSLGLAVIRR